MCMRPVSASIGIVSMPMLVLHWTEKGMEKMSHWRESSCFKVS